APVAWRRRPRPSGSPAAFPAFPAHLPFPALLFLPSVLLPRRRRRRPPILLPRRRRRRRRPLARSLSLPLLLQLAQQFALLGLRVDAAADASSVPAAAQGPAAQVPASASDAQHVSSTTGHGVSSLSVTRRLVSLCLISVRRDGASCQPDKFETCPR